MRCILSYEETIHHMHRFVDLGSTSSLNPTEEEINVLWKHWSYIVHYVYMKDGPLVGHGSHSARAIFKMVVQYDEEQHRKRVWQLAQDKASDDDSIVEIRRSTPLHCLFKLLRKYSNRQCHARSYTLTQLVQLLLDAGASVQYVNNDGHCTFRTLTHEIKKWVSSPETGHVHTGRTILNTVHVMLEACSDDNWTQDNRLEHILEFLLPNQCLSDATVVEFVDLNFVNDTAEKFQIIASIIHRIVDELARKIPREFSRSYKTKWLADIMEAAQLVAAMGTYVGEFPELLEKIMSSLSDMFHSILVHGVDDNLYYYNSQEWLCCFIFLARYYTRPSESNNFMRHLLNGLRPSQVNELKATLLACQKSVTDEAPIHLIEGFLMYLGPEEMLIILKSALEWLNKVQTPRNLQHLARDSVILAMSHRSLAGASTLEVPKHLIPFILMETDN